MKTRTEQRAAREVKIGDVIRFQECTEYGNFTAEIQVTKADRRGTLIAIHGFQGKGAEEVTHTIVRNVSTLIDFVFPERTSRDGGVLVTTNGDARDSWILRLRKIGYNHFVIFLDTRGPALQYGFAEWAVKDCHCGYYVCR